MMGLMDETALAKAKKMVMDSGFWRNKPKS